MDPAPLPPHERHWRHPSELAPTTADVDSSNNGRALVLATGTTALLIVAVMFVALTPPRSSAPSAVSATTLPSASIELQAAASQADQGTARGQVRTNRSSVLSENGVALVGAPNAVSAAPIGDADDFAVAGDVPAVDERVVVLTTSHAYDVRWGDIPDIAAPDGSIVMTRDGWLLATFVNGELRLLVN